MAKVLLVGLDHPLAEELIKVLQQLGQTVQTAALGSGALETGDINLVFAASDDLGVIRRTRPDLPVVVVSRLPEVSAWLDALEQGAADYCGAPFERKQVGWVLNSSLTPTLRTAA
jgi:DNA-binding response OmpR family regulator